MSMAVTPTPPPAFDLVVPTIARPDLGVLLESLDASVGPRPGRLVVVDDRRRSDPPLRLPVLRTLAPMIVPSGGRGPAAARNVGWRRCGAEWIAFLDDDVIPPATWLGDLASDLRVCGDDVCIAASKGGVWVPMPTDRRPTDAERAVVNLETAAWITADLAVRRRALLASGGFDERFRRAYREDTELALRLMDRGMTIVEGCRAVTHPVRSGTWSASVRAQRGNADDALMQRLHGSTWRERGRSPRGCLREHVATTWVTLVSAALAIRGRSRSATAMLAVAAGRIIAFWWRRARQGPAELVEWTRLAGSSVVIPFAAAFWAAWGRARARRLAPQGARHQWAGGRPALVLFDRDGTLIHDVAYNGDPARVEPVAGARDALVRVRRAGIPVGLVTNQSGVARGLIRRSDVDAVNRRVEELLGPFATVQVCEHGERDHCRCRKPAPGMISAAAAAVGVPPHRTAVVGDIGSDVDAGLAAGARAVLVPNSATSLDEISAAPEVAADLGAAVALLLDERRCEPATTTDSGRHDVVGRRR
jgi:histidinol-phosphate phosphatase family protein